MCWSIVMIQLPVFYHPEVWSFVPNCIMELGENLLIVHFCQCVSFCCILVMHNSTDTYQRTVLASPWFCFITCRAIFSHEYLRYFHCNDCALLYPYTHDLSPVTKVFRNLGSVQVVSSRSCSTSRWSSVLREIKNQRTRIIAPHSALRGSNWYTWTHRNNSGMHILFHCAQWHHPSITTVIGIHFRETW